MSIKIKWPQVTTPGASILVYRALTQITYDNLPVPLATLTTAATEYTDLTSVIYTTYYYAIGVKVNDDISLSPTGWVIDMPSNGPGGKTIIRGDARAGYMGTLTGAELISPAALVDLIAIPGTFTANTAATFRWIKFVHENKIKYIPNLYVATGSGVSWNVLYNNGLVFGVDGPGPRPTDLTDVNQNRIITINGERYRVRLLRNNRTLTADAQAPADPTMEWTAIVRAMYNTSTGTEPYEALLDYNTAASMSDSANTATAEWSGTYCGGCASSTNTSAVFNAAATKLRTGVNMRWFPVLELVV